MSNGKNTTATRICLTILAALAATSPPAANASTGSDLFVEVRSSLAQKTADDAIPSICVAVAQDGEVIWEEAFGWADKENRIKATPHTPYLLASLAKPITATCIMLLVERGKMDLDGRIADYIGDLELSARGESPESVTVRHMLNHTSGLPLYFNYFYADDKRQPPTFAETVGRYGLFVEPPGRVFRYANLGYDILCHAVAMVSGKSYTVFVRDELFALLGLEDSYLGTSGERCAKPAVRYKTNGEVLPTSDIDLAAGTPALASVHDLIRFGMFHLMDHAPEQTSLLPEETLDAMHWGKGEDVVYDSDTYGLGWFFRENDYGYRTFWHEGGMSGASAMLKLVPDQDIGVALVMNVFDQPLANAITNDILDLLLPEYAENRKNASPRSANQFGSFVPSEETTGIWRGHVRTYEGDIPIIMVFDEDGDIHVLTRPFFDHSVLMPNQKLWDAVLNNTGVMGNRIYGWTTIALDTEDTANFPYVTIMDVTCESRIISGAVTAIAAADRMYYALSSYVRLEKD